MENILCMISLHYISDRNDTPMWADQQKAEKPPLLMHLLELWNTRCPEHHDIPSTGFELFGPAHLWHVAQGQGVLNKEVDLIHTPEQLELYDFTATAIKKINSSEYISVVVTNQSVIARNLTDEAGLRIIHNKLEWLLGLEHTKIDDIYYCPHHPHGGFEGENKAYKIECECRKPKSGMLLQAKEKYHIDLQKSWIIGDTERDIIAGKNVGCTTIGVRTGYGCKHLKTPPDYMFANVLEAVNFIIDQPFENIYQTIFEKYSLHQTKKPFVINIGGNTGSGKSTLTTYLQKEFEKQQIKVLRIDLDDWILPKEEREHAKDVFERFNILQLIKDVFAILVSKVLSVNSKVLNSQTLLLLQQKS
jgi:D,D-heptose 1,7-bisphosphate phosphatase